MAILGNLLKSTAKNLISSLSPATKTATDYLNTRSLVNQATKQVSQPTKTSILSPTTKSSTPSMVVPNALNLTPVKAPMQLKNEANNAFTANLKPVEQINKSVQKNIPTKAQQQAAISYTEPKKTPQFILDDLAKSQNAFNQIKTSDTYSAPVKSTTPTQTGITNYTIPSELSTATKEITYPERTATDTALKEINPEADATTQRLKQIREQLINYGPTQEENDLQDKISTIEAQQRNIQQSGQLGIFGEGQRPIPMNFITGRQSAIEGRAALQLNGLENQRKTLVDQLANIQANRQAERERLTTESGFLESDLTQRQQAEAAAREAEAQAQEKYATQLKPFEFGGSLVQYDPATGQLVELAKGPEKEVTPVKLGYGETLINPKTGEVIAQRGENEQEVALKQAQINQINANIQKIGLDIAEQMNPNTKKPLSGDAAKVLSIAETMPNEINQLIEAFQNDYNGTVRGILLGTDRNLVRLVDSVADKVGRLRSGGAINSDEAKSFKSQIVSKGDLLFGNSDTTVNALRRILDEAGGVRASILGESTPYGEDIGTAWDTAFQNDLSMSQKGSEISKIANAIGQFESGGNYKAVGPTVTSGAYAGDHAYGKYQIMGKNIPSWTKEATGRSYSVQEFLNNPQIQDITAQYKMNQSYQQYGNVGDVASIWFSGRPLSKAGNAKDVIGTTVPQYVRNVINNYNSMG